MERLLQPSTARGTCAITNCNHRTGRRIRMIRHVESHFLLNICSCGYFSSYRNTTTKHGRIKHNDEKLAVMQVDHENYHIARNFIAGMPDTVPTLPVRLKDPRKDCIPRRRDIAIMDYQIPRVSLAVVATEAVDLQSVGDRATAKIPKALTFEICWTSDDPY